MSAPHRTVSAQDRFGWDTLALEPATILLSHDVERESQAFYAGALIADLLRSGVEIVAPGCAAPETGVRLRVHVGEAPPAATGGAPLLHVRPTVRALDTTIRIDDPLYGPFGPLPFPMLGWAHAPFDGATVVDSDRGPVCTRRDNLLTMNADLGTLFGHEVLRHGTATCDVAMILRALHVMAYVLSQVVEVRPLADRAISLLTIDAEDQQRYFINRDGVCSNINGVPEDDLQFAKSCRTAMDRCEAFGLKAIFMVTGDEIDPSFVDAFGDQLVGLDDNRSVLDEIRARGHDVACHGFDHEWWLSKGHSANPPMSMREKLAYFAETGGNLRMLLGFGRFLVRYRQELWAARARKNAREVSIGEPFALEEVAADLARWRVLVDHSDDCLFIRYPGYVRSPETINCLDTSFAAVVDSSDICEPSVRLPIRPYRILGRRADGIYRSKVIEIPCLMVDKILRTRNQTKVDAHLDGLAACARCHGSILSLISHTKVLGGAWGHCHLYLHDPLRGMGLPMVRESFEKLASLLSDSTHSWNWRELRTALFEDGS